jgi:hypothetical protein
MEKGLMLKDEWGNLGLDGLKDVKDLKVEVAAPGGAGEGATRVLEEKKS